MIDICPLDRDPFEDYQAIRRELQGHSPTLADKQEIIVANKMDLTDSEKHLDALRKKLGKEVVPISAVTGAGLEQLTEIIWNVVNVHLEEENRSN